MKRIASVIFALGALSSQAGAGTVDFSQTSANFTTGGTTPQISIFGAIANAQTAPSIQSAISESHSGGYIGNSLVMLQTGGSGPLRETLHVELLSGVAASGDQLSPLTSIAHVTGTGSGTAYGINPYCWIDSGVAASAQCIGAEVDVDARGNVAAKVGMQIVDVGTSVGTGTSIEAALLTTKQIGAVGFATGLQFGYTAGTSSTGVRSTGTLIRAIGGDTLASGIDFTDVSFTNYSINTKSFKLTDAGQLDFGSQTSPGTATLNFHSQGNTNVNAQVAVSGSGVLGGTMSFGAGAFQFNVGAVFANAGLAVGGNITATSLPTSGTVRGSVCIDTSNRLYVKTTAGSCL